MELTANIYKKLSLHFYFQTICQDLSFYSSLLLMPYFDCLERLRTAEKADVWRYIKCFILLLLYLSVIIHLFDLV